METWGLWRREGTAIEWSLVRTSDVDAFLSFEGEGFELVWTVEAASANDACRQRNEYLGWEPYKPMLRADGSPYPEEE